MCFTVTLSCSNNEAEQRCETAFAVQPGWTYLNPPDGPSACFLDLNDSPVFVPQVDDTPQGTFKRWGWSNGSNWSTSGSSGFNEGSYSFHLYAGAGRCILTNGTLVATVNVHYSAGKASVRYTITNTAGGWQIDEIHVYAGSEPLPRNVSDQYTVAPGQYTIIKDHVENPLSDTTTIGQPLSGPIYLLAHATVCWDL